MNRRFALGTLVLAPLSLVALAGAGGWRSDDTADIKKSTQEFQAAWNKHDAKAMAAMWAKDGDLIDPWGKTSVGRAEVEKFFQGEHTGKGPLAHCTYDCKKDTVRMLSKDVALEDWEVILTGLQPEGADKPLGPQFHRVVVIKKKDGDKWLVAAARPGLPTPVEGATKPAK